MSKVGNTPIFVPKGVEVQIKKEEISAKGPKGTRAVILPWGIEVAKEEDYLIIKKKEETSSADHGLYRALINNLITGVEKGFEKRLSLIGVGFRAAVKGNKLELLIGFSFPIDVEIPQGLQIKVEKSVEIIITGMDRQQVGQFAATVRSKRPPEPYKGKGIRYVDEYVRKKAGKTAAKGA